MEERKSYNDYDSWRGFMEYFPEKTRINPGEEPQEEYWDWQDYHVHLDRYIPEGEAKDTKIILVHGGGANGRLMFPLAVILRSNGYECVSPDMPGFGLTQINKANSYFTWIDLVVDLAEREYKKDGKKIVLAGISLGGMLSYQAACKSDYVKGIIVSALADTRTKDVQLALSKNKFMGTFGVEFTKKMGFAVDRMKLPIKATTKMWAMANNQEFVNKLMADKVGSGSWVYVKFLRTMFKAGPPIEPEEFDKCPILVVQPEKDHIMPWSVTEPFYNRLLICKKEKVVLENCGHIPLEEPGVWQMEEKCLAFIESL